MALGKNLLRSKLPSSNNNKRLDPPNGRVEIVTEGIPLYYAARWREKIIKMLTLNVRYY
jgi:hypothetical protein